MATIRQFEDILSWQKARDLTREIYTATRKDEFSKDFALKDQIRRAAISITSNIAEGFERDGSREFVQFLSHAKGSCGEVRSQLYLALDAGYLKEDEWKTLHQSCLEISRLIDSFSNYLRDTEIKGSKFKKTPATEPT
ncbi:MAG: four helix bundle protein [Verrucomicrobiales bacterium]